MVAGRSGLALALLAALLAAFASSPAEALGAEDSIAGRTKELG